MQLAQRYQAKGPLRPIQQSRSKMDTQGPPLAPHHELPHEPGSSAPERDNSPPLPSQPATTLPPVSSNADPFGTAPVLEPSWAPLPVRPGQHRAAARTAQPPAVSVPVFFHRPPGHRAPMPAPRGPRQTPKAETALQYRPHDQRAAPPAAPKCPIRQAGTPNHAPVAFTGFSLPPMGHQWFGDLPPGPLLRLGPAPARPSAADCRSTRHRSSVRRSEESALSPNSARAPSMQAPPLAGQRWSPDPLMAPDKPGGTRSFFNSRPPLTAAWPRPR
ncbi:hypothetical protein NDU88_004977 [Pleurodeles waltl]|uniref:Uncharacterized protein n=1 Tax=Pleurodeles waltl TaxID=8319 RepID=A0AAV7UJM2_PLEWA|nr:hypothetical protein NDU88_004977 [Pleurodeles waltl]